MSRTTTDLAAEDRDLARLAAAFSKAAAELVPGGVCPIRVIDEAEIYDFHSGACQFVGDAGEIAFETVL